jgi:hypothetical protein
MEPPVSRKDWNSGGAYELGACPEISIWLEGKIAMTIPVTGSTIRVLDPVPFGDMVLAPPEATGRSQAELARSMAEHLLAKGPESNAEALSVLRRAFPHAPLTARVAALAALMRRSS